MKQFFFIISLLISFTAFSQEDEYYRSIDWKFYPDSIVQLTDSTYQLVANPFDHNDPGAINRTVGNYVVDFVGHRYLVIDSTSTKLTVKDIYSTGQAPQTGQIARCYKSAYYGEADFVGSVDYSPLDESAKWKLNGADNEIIWRSFIRYSYVGVVNEPTITKNPDGTVTIASNGDYIFNQQADGKGRNINVENVTGTTLNITDNAVSYVYVDYNNGTPFYAFASENAIFFWDFTKLPVIRVTRLGTQTHFEEPGEFAVQLANKLMYKDVAVNTFQRQSGLTLSTSATRISTISSGVAWFAIKYYNLTANTAGSAGNLYQYYLSGGNWLKSLVTSYDADYYSDGTNRQTLGVAKWVAKYFYRDVGDDNEAYYIHGNQYNTSAEALAETLPFAPNIITAHSIYVGKIVIQKGATNGTAYPRQWEGAIQSATSSNHPDLTNLGWTVSNHTSSANKIAAFDATGAATTLDTITNIASQYDLVSKVTGPASSTDNAIARFDGTTGKLIQNSGVTISDAGAIVTPSTIQATTGLFTNLNNNTISYHESDASGLKNTNITVPRSNVININTGFTNTSDFINQTAGSIEFINVANGTAIPTISGKSASNHAGLFFTAVTTDANPNYDMMFSVREIDNTDFSDLTKIGFRWARFGTTLMDLKRNGELQLNNTIQSTTAKLTNLTDNYIPKHTSDAIGLQNSNIFFSGNIARYGTANTFSNDRDIVDKAYVDAIAAGNMPKLPVDAATTANITLSGTQTIDGYSAGVGSRILVWKQTTTSQNGVYIVASGAWTRATDLDTWAELYKAYVTVLNGAQSGSSFVCTVPSTGTLGTDPVTWILYNAPTNITVSSPLAKSGNNISLGYDTNTLDVASGNLKVKDNVFQGKTTALTNTTAAYKTADSTKLAGIAAGAEVNVNADWTASSGDAQILNKPTALSQFTNDLGNYGGFLTAETDPIFAADSSKILHWSDTLNTTKGIASQYDLTTGLATKQNTLTTGNLTEGITGLEFSSARQVIGGATQLNLTSGYFIPTTIEQTQWTGAYNDKINSLAFSGTTTKTLTLTQQDGGSVSNTFTDLDIQTLTADSTTTTIGLTASGSNSRVHFNVDKSATNEIQNLSLGTVTTTAQPLNISNGTGVTLPAATTSTAGLLTSADKTKLDGIATGANNYSLPLATNGTRGGIQIGYTSTANNFALQLSSEKAYTALPDATTSTKGIASFNSGNFSVSSGAVSITTGGVSAANLSNSVISGQVDIAADIVDTDEFLISDAGTLKRTDASRLKTFIGAGFADPMTTAGDIIYRNQSNVTTRLPIGTSDYVLKSYMGIPSWQPVMSGITSGAVPFNNGSGSLNNDGVAFTYNSSTNTLDVDNVTVDSETYGIGWSGDNSVPTKSDLYTKIESLPTGSKWTDTGLNFTYLTNSTSDLGIGYTTDQGTYKLQVNGDGYYNGNLYLASSKNLYIGSTNIYYGAAIQNMEFGGAATPTSGYAVWWAGTDGRPHYTNDSGSSFDLTKAYTVNSGAPASSSASGSAGEIRYDSNYIYICIATNTWKRVALSTW